MVAKTGLINASDPPRAGSFLRFTAIVQGLYFAVTGIWPLIHMPSFLAVTGPKIDLWLVETVGVLVLGIGLSLLVAAARRQIGIELLVMVLVVSIGLAIIDIVYASSDRIWDVYLLDAAAEVAFVGLWLIGWFLSHRERSVREAPNAL